MRKVLGLVASLLMIPSLSAQPAGPLPLATPGRPGANRVPVGPVDNDRYRSTLVKLGEGVREGLFYEPKAATNGIAVLYSDRNFGFDPPAAELASRGYRVLYVSYPPLAPGGVSLPYDGFRETSAGIAWLRRQPGVNKVVIEGWGAGASSMTLYADLAAHGPAACQGSRVIYPCSADQASGLERPDGLILLDPGLGAGTKVSNIDPSFIGTRRSLVALDRFAATNGYDAQTGHATYTPAFRRRFFAAQSARNRAVLAKAVARLRDLEKTGGKQANEPFFVPGAANLPGIASLHYADLSLLSRTKAPHILLAADGTQQQTILHSIRPATGPVGEAAIAAAIDKIGRPASAGYSLRDYLANDALRTTGDFALTQDDVRGVDWASSNLSTPAQAAGVAIPTLIMTNTCFQFVVPSEITFDHLAARDKTLAGVEGSEHEFTPCKPQYGDTKGRLFSFVAQWLGKSGRF